MALIKCPECGRMVSDMAAACPQCGYPISSALKQRNTGTASGLQIPTPIRKAAYMQSYIETISENERTVDNAFRHDKAIRKIVDGQKCVLTPLYHCYLYRNAALRDGFFIVGATCNKKSGTDECRCPQSQSVCTGQKQQASYWRCCICDYCRKVRRGLYNLCQYQDGWYRGFCIEHTCWWLPHAQYP